MSSVTNNIILVCDTTHDEHALIRRMEADGGLHVTEPVIYYVADHPSHLTGFIEPMCRHFGGLNDTTPVEIDFPTTHDKLTWMAHVSCVLFEEDAEPTLVVSEGVTFKKRLDQLPPPPEDADLIFFECGEKEMSDARPHAGAASDDDTFFIEKSGGYCELDPTKVVVKSHLCYWVRNPRALCDFCCAHPDTYVNSLSRYQREGGHKCYVFWVPVVKAL